jgi:hypothetical protein
MICKDSWCVQDPCDAAACAAQGGICKGGECIDPCKNVTCDKYEQCVKGACIDMSCYNPDNKCPDGEICVQGTCVADPCDGKDCGPEAFCRDGQCVKLCDTLSCGQGEQCQVVVEDGKAVARCVPDPCAGKQCGPGWVCKEGQCVDDPCLYKSCDEGEVCIDGACVVDPCEKVSCPRFYVCKEGSCVTDSMVGERELLASGSGGLACNVSGRGTSLPLPFLLLCFGLLLAAGRRRTER